MFSRGLLSMSGFVWLSICKQFPDHNSTPILLKLYLNVCICLEYKISYFWIYIYISVKDHVRYRSKFKQLFLSFLLSEFSCSLQTGANWFSINSACLICYSTMCISVYFELNSIIFILLKFIINSLITLILVSMYLSNITKIHFQHGQIFHFFLSFNCNEFFQQMIQ